MKVGLDGTSEYMAIVDIKRVDEKAKIPTRGSDGAAGYDMYANIGVDELAIAPHTTVKIGTGICMSIPSGYYGAIYARSGIALKKGLRPANAVGVCDSDFTGEITVALHNDTDEYQTIQDGERIAQIVITPFLPVEFNEVEELRETKRGGGGFGSTGEK
jgi:dUTP pyrophosphatase